MTTDAATTSTERAADPQPLDTMALLAELADTARAELASLERIEGLLGTLIRQQRENAAQSARTPPRGAAPPSEARTRRSSPRAPARAQQRSLEQQGEMCGCGENELYADYPQCSGCYREGQGLPRDRCVDCGNWSGSKWMRCRPCNEGRGRHGG